MSKELSINDKILETIRMYFNYGDGRDLDLTTEIEKLLLSEKIELLKTIDLMGSMIVLGEGDNIIPIKNKISEFTSQLNSIKK